ncbi:exodeoxyribonuclease VII small subunit [Thalassotalea sediminis]|uniref:exodeoxyribonuclease VII small subunit n=1 Tax=Thalassotalea sediminis TaxID=1759089 RepID=UPI002572C6CF|nr:exodeoxyribonuclease VII small subunit [Thalassotalea sediminis]
MARKKIENLNFEDALKELEIIVEQLEKGELNLEDSMTLFERGLSLSQVSQKKLKDAEQKVQILMQRQEKSSLENFESKE